MKSISVVLCIWKPSNAKRHIVKDLYHALHCWKSQTLPPKEVLVVDINTDVGEQDRVDEVVSEFGFTHIVAPMPPNASRALNIGIREASGEYILVTGADVWFAPNYLEAVTPLLAPDRFYGAVCGFLKCEAEVKSDVLEEWEELLKQMREGAPRYGLGAMQLVHRDWWREIGGYDENLKLRGIDSYIIGKVKKTRMTRCIVKWDVAQMIHIKHGRTRMPK